MKDSKYQNHLLIKNLTTLESLLPFRNLSCLSSTESSFTLEPSLIKNIILI